jgi:hypothetical protein
MTEPPLGRSSPLKKSVNPTAQRSDNSVAGSPSGPPLRPSSCPTYRTTAAHPAITLKLAPGKPVSRTVNCSAIRACSFPHPRDEPGPPQQHELGCEAGYTERSFRHAYRMVLTLVKLQSRFRYYIRHDTEQSCLLTSPVSKDFSNHTSSRSAAPSKPSAHPPCVQSQHVALSRSIRLLPRASIEFQGNGRAKGTLRHGLPLFPRPPISYPF